MMEVDEGITSIPMLGARVGAVTGLKLSFIYVLLFALPVALGESIGGFYTFADSVMSFLLLFLYCLLFGSVVGILPSLLLGTITGWLMGKALVQRGVGSSRHAARVGVVISLAVALLVNSVGLLVAYPSSVTDLRGWLPWYMLFLGVPTLIYIVAAGWMSARFYSAYLSAHAQPRGVAVL